MNRAERENNINLLLFSFKKLHLLNIYAIFARK